MSLPAGKTEVKMCFKLSSENSTQLQSLYSSLKFQGLTLHFVVLSFDRYSRDDVIGEVLMDLSEVSGDLADGDENSQTVNIVKEIAPRSLKVVRCTQYIKLLPFLFILR